MNPYPCREARWATCLFTFLSLSDLSPTIFLGSCPSATLQRDLLPLSSSAVAFLSHCHQRVYVYRPPDPHSASPSLFSKSFPASLSSSPLSLSLSFPVSLTFTSLLFNQPLCLYPLLLPSIPLRFPFPVPKRRTHLASSTLLSLSLPFPHSLIPSSFTSSILTPSLPPTLFPLPHYPNKRRLSYRVLSFVSSLHLFLFHTRSSHHSTSPINSYHLHPSPLHNLFPARLLHKHEEKQLASYPFPTFISLLPSLRFRLTHSSSIRSCRGVSTSMLSPASLSSHQFRNRKLFEYSVIPLTIPSWSPSLLGDGLCAENSAQSKANLPLRLIKATPKL